MEQLTPIPTPAAQRWREFRIQALPVLTFIAVIACVAVLWQRYVFPSNIIAQVEMATAPVITTVPGTIEKIAVGRFQQVKKGDIIAVISTEETNLLSATLSSAQAELQVMRSRVEQGNFRSDQTYERERLNYLEQKLTVDVDRVNLKLAEAEFRIQDALMNEKPPLTDSNKWAAAYYKVEALKTKITEMDAFLKVKEQTLPKLLSDSTNTMATIESAIRAEQARLQAAATNVFLRAPMDGVVSALNNRAGERIMAGTPVAIITGSKSDRIIAYMRPPLTAIPKTGDTLQVRRRTFKRQAATAVVGEVGTQLEPIIPALVAAVGSTAKVDLGLPFAVSLPASMKLIPGEIVDIIYNPKTTTE